jgi:hypothetical protein
VSLLATMSENHSPIMCFDTELGLMVWLIRVEAISAPLTNNAAIAAIGNNSQGGKANVTACVAIAGNRGAAMPNVKTHASIAGKHRVGRTNVTAAVSAVAIAGNGGASCNAECGYSCNNCRKT